MYKHYEQMAIKMGTLSAVHYLRIDLHATGVVGGWKAAEMEAWI